MKALEPTDWLQVLAYARAQGLRVRPPPCEDGKPCVLLVLNRRQSGLPHGIGRTSSGGRERQRLVSRREVAGLHYRSNCEYRIASCWARPVELQLVGAFAVPDTHLRIVSPANTLER
jgi:hypothetical protein